ncbi:hypothetical protein V2J09_003575 [Rumex salicifolius]
MNTSPILQFEQVDQGDHDHQDPSCSTSTSDVFSFWSDDVQPQQQEQEQEREREQQEHNQLLHPPNVAFLPPPPPPPQVLDGGDSLNRQLESAYLNLEDYCHQIPCQTDPVVATTGTGMSIGETSNQGRGEHSKRRLKSAQTTAHSVSEKRRRDKFKEKIKTLHELLPDCNKTDTASVLDKAVKHIQLLKLQAQELYMASSIRRMSPTPMIPTQQTANVIGMLPYPSMQQLQYPIIPPMQMQMVPFFPPRPLLPVGHITTSIGATAGPRGGTGIAPIPGGPPTQVIGGGSSQLHGGGGGGGGGSTPPSSAGGNKWCRGKGTRNTITVTPIHINETVEKDDWQEY